MDNIKSRIDMTGYEGVEYNLLLKSSNDELLIVFEGNNVQKFIEQQGSIYDKFELGQNLIDNITDIWSEISDYIVEEINSKNLISDENGKVLEFNIETFEITEKSVSSTGDIVFKSKYSLL